MERISMDKGTASEFRTTSGICAITSEQIAFARPSAGSRRGSSLKALASIAYAGLLFGFGIYFFLLDNIMMAIILILAGLALPWLQLLKESKAVAPNIARQAIRKFEAHAPISVLTRGYFVVWYQQEGKLRQQRIVVQGGAEEYSRAVEAMRAAGLPQT
jgi:hypothetical protein